MTQEHALKLCNEALALIDHGLMQGFIRRVPGQRDMVQHRRLFDAAIRRSQRRMLKALRAGP